MDTALLQNSWVAKSEELLNMEDEAKKTLLIEQLNAKLNPDVHTIVDLSLRAISAEQGGLCGLAALYQAMQDTILTNSQLRNAGYTDILTAMVQEMRMDPRRARDKSDAQMLMLFYDCKFSFSMSFYNFIA